MHSYIENNKHNSNINHKCITSVSWLSIKKTFFIIRVLDLGFEGSIEKIIVDESHIILYL